jgi:hypothetical protein
MSRSMEQVRGQCARGSLERGGPHPKGRPVPERGETSPEGATGPRARWGFVSVVLCPSSEEVFRPRVAGQTVLVGCWGDQGRDYVVRVLDLQIHFVFFFLRKKVGFPRFLADPYGCPRQ